MVTLLHTISDGAAMKKGLDNLLRLELRSRMLAAALSENWSSITDKLSDGAQRIVNAIFQ